MSIACLLTLAAVAASTPDSPQPFKAEADSVRSLQSVLSREFQAGNKVFKLEDQGKIDSLLRNATRKGFLDRMKDTALARDFSRKSEFDSYWKRVQSEYGYPSLKGQLAGQDVDKSRVPKAYLFDSSVVVYPGWIILRRSRR
jgi:hypothetical protein